MKLEAKNIGFRYQKKLPWVLEGVDLAVNCGERLALLAPSGYGKTTLAMVLSGYLKPQRGEVLLDERPLAQKGVCPVQLIYQHPEKAINPRWKLRRVLEEAGTFSQEMLSSFGIEPDWLSRFPRELSGGELQRFCVARALLSEPQFLICDEISAMLDAVTQAQIWQRILEEGEKRPLGLIVITHNLFLAKRVCTKGYDLEKDEYTEL